MSNYSEDSILQIIDTLFVKEHSSLLLGRGDDCCIFQAKQHCVSTDMFLEDIHFRLSYFSAYDVGYKCLAVNISDIAACAAKPIAFTLNLALPQHFENIWLHEFFKGMSELANKYEMVLAGGDLSLADKLYISITIWGESINNAKFLTRGHCNLGDSIFCVGALGLARAGLSLLEKQGRVAMQKWPKLCAAHLSPLPQVEAALIISKLAQDANCPPPALMDISDGLARDLPRLLSSTGNLNCCGGDLTISHNLLEQELIDFCKEYHLDPLAEAFKGGEDYALLGSCPSSLVPSLQKALPSFKILGKVIATPHLVLNNKIVPADAGFDHFANS